jgi:cysteine desulfurase
VLGGGRFPADRVEQLAVTGEGVVDLAALARAIAASARPLVSVMHANNETGVIQPIHEIAGIVHAAGGLLHVDAAQTAGRIDCDIEALGADLLTISAHKLGGPQGAGALVRSGDIHIAEPLMKGGAQERNQRAGTENVAAIAGFGAACAAAQAARDTDAARMAALRDRLEADILAASPGAVIFGRSVARLPNTTLAAVPGTKAETAVIVFDLNGIALSSGSACSSGKVQASHVLAAMGVEPALAHGALRISLGWLTTEADLQCLLTAWKNVISSLPNRQNIAA